MIKVGKPHSTKGLALFCAKIAANKIAEDILIMDLSAIEYAPADYFMICSCKSETQVRAVTEEIDIQAKYHDIDKPRIEGMDASQWVILDYFDVVVHVMHSQARDFYKLEKLWGDAAFYRINEEGKERAVKPEELKEIFARKLVSFTEEEEVVTD